jgi:flavin-dependent dehydrogenase
MAARGESAAVLHRTWPLADMASRRWDAVVVGAGPAGSVAAGELARRNRDVLLVDRAAFGRGKVCGCCLNGRALAALSAAGHPNLPQRLGAIPLTRFHLAAKGRSVELPLPAGVALSREALDAGLVRAATERGAVFLSGTTATLTEAEDTGRRLRLSQGETTCEVCTAVVVAADGLGSGLLSRAGLGAAISHPRSRIGAGAILSEDVGFYRPGVVYMNSGADGYVGLVRLEDGRLDVAAALAPEAVRAAGSPGPLVRRIITAAGLPAPRSLDEARWHGTPALTRQRRQVAHHRLFVLGDAAGYIEPFTGEGMAWALSSALALAPLASAAVESWRPGFIRAWQQRYRQVVRRRQFPCRLAGALLRWPGLVGGLIRVLRLLPGLARPVMTLLNHPSPLQIADCRLQNETNCLLPSASSNLQSAICNLQSKEPR